MKLLVMLSAGLLVATPAEAVNCSLKSGISPDTARAGLCGFDPTARQFAGSASTQARCLTRAVKIGAEIGSESITPEMLALVGQAIPFDRSRLESYLTRKGAASSELGGPLNIPITSDYFIIHDTSTPNCSDPASSKASCPVPGAFPPNRDSSDWRDNQTFQGHPKVAPHRIAHVFVSRTGGSVTEVDLAQAFATTKFEQCSDAASKSGLFVGIENIQPRIGKPPIVPAGKQPNDLVAPLPGFSARQYDRLALVYLAASLRRGKFLIPAFHAVVDHQYADGHDDPQNFDMKAFTSAVQAHLLQLK